VEDAAAAGVATPACPTPDGTGCTVFFTCTNKTQARVHGIPPDFLAALLAQDTLASCGTGPGLALALGRAAQGAAFATPPLAAFLPQAAAPFQSGWAVEFYLGRWDGGGARARWPGAARLPGRAQGRQRAPGSRSSWWTMATWTPCRRSRWCCGDDAGTQAALTLGRTGGKLLYRPLPAAHHVAFIVDGAARVAMAVVDGFLCNTAAGGVRGWAYLPMNLTTVHPTPTFVWGGEAGRVRRDILGGRWYSRALSVTEAVGNSRAGPQCRASEAAGWWGLHPSRSFFSLCGISRRYPLLLLRGPSTGPTVPRSISALRP
jgi:hypothetical protein